MSVQDLVADLHADKARETESKIRKLVKALAKLGCSCSFRSEDPDLEAHECFCRYRMAMENIGVVP